MHTRFVADVVKSAWRLYNIDVKLAWWGFSSIVAMWLLFGISMRKVTESTEQLATIHLTTWLCVACHISI